MRCKKCDSTINYDCNFCPACGERVSLRGIGSIFNVGLEDIFTRFMDAHINEAIRNFEELNSHSHDFESRPHPANRKVKGMSIRIFHSANSRPMMNVGRFEAAKQIDVSRAENPASANAFMPEAKHAQNEQQHAESPQIPTIEPKIDITRMPGKIVIDAVLAEVKSMNDIRILEFGESLEIRARSKDKNYLKIVQIPPELHVIGNIFSGEMLRIELGK